MEIFISKVKVIKGILLGLLMTSAALLVSVKVFYILFPANRSLLVSPFELHIIPLIVGLVSIFGFFWFGLMTLAFIARLFQSEPQVIITLEGIEDKRLNSGLIGWNEIGFISQEEVKYGQWLTLTLHSPEKYHLQLPKFELFLRKINGQKGLNNFRIRFTDLDTPINEAWNFIENNIIKPREEKSLCDIATH
jgi:hypothetical protein